jgi:hypothetical protein
VSGRRGILRVAMSTRGASATVLAGVLVVALLMLIDPYPWAAPLEELRLRKK